MDYFDAKEARETSIINFETNNAAKLNEIYSGLNESVTAGTFSAVFIGDIDARLEQFLTIKGYKVSKCVKGNRVVSYTVSF